MRATRRPSPAPFRRRTLLPALLVLVLGGAAGGAPRAPLDEPALGVPAWARHRLDPALSSGAAARLGETGRPGRPVASAVPLAGIGELVSRVDSDSLDENVDALERYRSRRTDLPECRAAAAWLAARFRSFGIDSLFVHDWYFDSAPNVIAIRRGSVRPHEIYVIGAHFDSYVRTGDRAPGADDNASGTAGVLECARVLGGARYEATLQFACFSGEEQGLLGSTAYAEHLVAQGDSVVGMLNLDMIGYLAEGDSRDLDLVGESFARDLASVVRQAGATYVPRLPIVPGTYVRTSASDHFSFVNQGIPALWFFEDSEDWSPYIHTAFDVSAESYNDPLLATLITQVATASLATLAVPVPVPVLVQDLSALPGPGRVEIEWRLASEASRSVVGVDVERAASAAGPYARLTSRPLPPAPRMRFEDPAPPPAGTVWYRLVLSLADGRQVAAGSLGLELAAAPTGLLLLPVAEDPAGGPVVIRYTLGRPESRLRLALFDVRGRWLRDLDTGPGTPGAHAVLWDRCDAQGARVARGLYFVRLTALGASAVRKLVLARN